MVVVGYHRKVGSVGPFGSESGMSRHSPLFSAFFVKFGGGAGCKRAEKLDNYTRYGFLFQSSYCIIGSRLKLIHYNIFLLLWQTGLRGRLRESCF